MFNDYLLFKFVGRQSSVQVKNEAAYLQHGYEQEAGRTVPQGFDFGHETCRHGATQSRKLSYDYGHMEARVGERRPSASQSGITILSTGIRLYSCFGVEFLIVFDDDKRRFQNAQEIDEGRN